ncbi:MAG: FtsX-like permease family protein [archaeon GB-1845-036]|nr:FtsX-like permease family protein [Candidatus Culexmicrobium thermophilum]HDO20008.1 ABC transporter permease [Candidatus Bathyarchaeota archaeon]
MKKHYAIIFLAIFILILMNFSSVQAASSKKKFNVKVNLKEENGEFISNAIIIILEKTEGRYVTYDKVRVENGSITLQMAEGEYRIYAEADLNSTPGYDYAISYIDIEVESDETVNITLIKGATIQILGEALNPEAEEPAKYISYTVENVSKIGETRILNRFGSGLEYAAPLELTENIIIIPANMKLNITCRAQYLVGREVKEEEYKLMGIKLQTGELVKIRLQEITLRKSMQDMWSKLNSTIMKLEAAERDGFYLAIYKPKMSMAHELIFKAEEELNAKSYDACYADLKEAAMTINHVNREITQLYLDAASSTLSITIFLAVTAAMIAGFLFEKGRDKTLTAIAIYIPLIYIFQNLYPGFRAVNYENFITWSTISIIFVIILFMIPQMFRETPRRLPLWSAIAAIFSIAKRNLRRRKLRTTLTLISILIITGGFVALTSVSSEEGLTIKTYPNNSGIIGLTIRRILPQGSKQPFIALPNNIIEKYHIEEKSEWYSFKMESIPRLSPIDMALNPLKAENKIPIFGAFALSNSGDPLMVKINEKIIEGKMPEKSGEIAVTEAMANALNIHVGGRILLVKSGRTFKITGILSNSVLAVVDHDGRTLTPEKMIIAGEEEPTIEVVDCNPEEVMFISWKDAEKFSLLPSRLYVRITDSAEGAALSKRIALTGDYIVTLFLPGKTVEYQYRTYVEVKGIGAMLTLAISMSNIGIVMLSSVYERRREVAVLSSLGLNPSHITFLFASEALIIGLIAGGLGYLLGLSFYRIAKIFNMLVEVYPKVSAFWTMATIAISALTAVIGAIPALKSSVIVTPSKLMKWKADVKPKSPEEPWQFLIPIRFSVEEVDDLVNYVLNSLRREMGVERIELKKRWSIRFRYMVGRGSMGASGSVNLLTIYLENGEPRIRLTVRSFGEQPEKHAYETAKLIRSIILRWRSAR